MGKKAFLTGFLLLAIVHNGCAVAQNKKVSDPSSSIPSGSFQGVRIASFEFGEPFYASATGLYSGSLIETSTDKGLSYRIKVLGAECPEPGQPQFDQATEFSWQLLSSGFFEVHPLALKSRLMRAHIVLPDESSLAEHLVESGWCWAEPRPEFEDLQRLQDQAQAEARGLWQYPSPVPPWQYRRELREFSSQNHETIETRGKDHP